MGILTVPLIYSISNERNCPKLVLNQFKFLKNFRTVTLLRVFSNDGLKQCAYGYLESHGYQIPHGMASDSRCFSRVERSNASLMRKVVKLSASLKLPIKAVLSQAVSNHNLQPSEALGGHCPALSSIVQCIIHAQEDY
jgi:hypothetical protein